VVRFFVNSTAANNAELGLFALSHALLTYQRPNWSKTLPSISNEWPYRLS